MIVMPSIFEEYDFDLILQVVLMVALPIMKYSLYTNQN